MSDIVERLDDQRKRLDGLLLDTAAEITRLRAALDAERERCAKVADSHGAWTRSFGAEKACEMVAAAIRALPPPEGAAVDAGWQPIETAPKDGRQIIVLTERKRVFKAGWVDLSADDSGWRVEREDDPRPFMGTDAWTDGFCWSSNECEERSDPPTHWRPLPPPPEAP